MKKRIAAVAAAIVSAAALTVSASAYNGYLCFQTGAWSYRNGWSDASVGKDSKYYDDIIMNGGGCDEGTYEDYDDYYDYDLGTYAIPVKWTNASFDGAGTYTVAIDDFDWSLDGSNAFNIGMISTDITDTEAINITSMTVYIDGVAAKTIDNPVSELTSDGKGTNFYFSNPWNDGVGAWTTPYPTSSLKVEFTVEGGAAAAPAAGDVAAATDSSKGSPDTGIEDVAVIAGLALVAGAGIAFTRKRK